MNKAIVRFAVLALFLVAVPVTAQQAWTSTGATGTVDETSLGIYATNLASIGFVAGPTGSIQARYNVTNAFGGGFTDTPPWNTLEMTYFDNSLSSGVAVTLFQVSRCTGAVTSLCTVSSTDSATNTCRTCNFAAGSINFAANSYWVELRMSRSVNTVNPQLIALRIF